MTILTSYAATSRVPAVQSVKEQQLVSKHAQISLLHTRHCK
jgi:hypothetical protein